MAVRPILELPHPALRRKARRVRRIDSSVLRLAHDLVDTMRDKSGVGLAANQIGVLRRVIVIQLPDEDEARIYVNPEIISREGERRLEEGCLSIPGYKGCITRAVCVKFGALDHTSKSVRLKADGLLSQALEHEIDHVNGVLYVDHLESHEKLVKIEPPAEDEGAPVGGEVAVATPARPEGRPEVREELPAPESDSRETPATVRIK